VAPQRVQIVKLEIGMLELTPYMGVLRVVEDVLAVELVRRFQA
jgi:hypothetical protein